MKRLNPDTGKPFVYGEVREDGKVFKCYYSKKLKNGFFAEDWRKSSNYIYTSVKRNTKANHIKTIMYKAKWRAKKLDLPYDLDLEHLVSIAPDYCPIFKDMQLGWGVMTNGKSTINSPSLDKIVPEKGYVKGNVQWLSQLGNQMKSSATTEQLKQFAEWILKKPL